MMHEAAHAGGYTDGVSCHISSNCSLWLKSLAGLPDPAFYWGLRMQKSLNDIFIELVNLITKTQAPAFGIIRDVVVNGVNVGDFKITLEKLVK